MTTTIILSVVFLALGIALGYFIAHSATLKAQAAGDAVANDAERLRHELAQRQTNLDALQQERPQLLSERDVLKAQAQSLQKNLDDLKAEAMHRYTELQQQYESRIATLEADHDEQMAERKDEHGRQLAELKANYEKQFADLKTDYASQKAEIEARYQKQIDEFHEQQKTQMEQQSTLIREQINNASAEILKKRQDELSSANREQLDKILSPLHEKLTQMREAVEKNEREQTTSMERLDASIKENLKQAREVGERADRLAQALTGENKTQGNFGELRLRTLLENMGLEEGTQFEEQVTLRDEAGQALHDGENGQRLQPDVVLHFPDERDVIIDSKMSLKAFLDYYEAKTEDERHDALQRHVASVRKHVNELSQKNYSSFIKKGHNKLDFVVMYVYNEGALQLALTADPTLWREAYDKGVVISGSQNLYMMLRVLELTWRQMRQVENQDNIMQTANELVNRVQLFYERFLKADEQLDRTRKAFDEVKRSTSPSGVSITVAARRLLKFGAKENPKRQAKLPDDAPEALPASD